MSPLQNAEDIIEDEIEDYFQDVRNLQSWKPGGRSVSSLCVPVRVRSAAAAQYRQHSISTHATSSALISTAEKCQSSASCSTSSCSCLPQALRTRRRSRDSTPTPPRRRTMAPRHVSRLVLYPSSKFKPFPIVSASNILIDASSRHGFTSRLIT